jgi:hypothetical protein
MQAKNPYLGMQGIKEHLPSIVTQNADRSRDPCFLTFIPDRGSDDGPWPGHRPRQTGPRGGDKLDREEDGASAGSTAASLRHSGSPRSSAAAPIQHHHDDPLVELNPFCWSSSPLHRRTLPPTELLPAISSPASTGPFDTGERLPETPLRLLSIFPFSPELPMRHFPRLAGASHAPQRREHEGQGHRRPWLRS